jgi:NAD(P)H-dependent FMN reductase
MKISIISGSHRKNSESFRISELLQKKIRSINILFKPSIVDLAKKDLPMWGSGSQKEIESSANSWKNISKSISSSLGFVFVVPEYGGMVTPHVKNFFLLCNSGELAHKPGLIVSVSSGNGGAYPVSELRASSYKNTHITWIPENVIIRNVEEFNPGNHGKKIPEWLEDRIDYVLKLLLAYASNMKPLRELINRKDFGNGM